MTTIVETGIQIPTMRKEFSLELPPEITALRDKARALHLGKGPGLPENTLADARAWAEHTGNEDWLIWRARRTAERLRSMPVEIEPGERIVGKPRLRHARPEEGPELKKAQEVLASMPPFPGGDPGHFHPDYEPIFEKGIGGILDEIASRQKIKGIADEQHTFYDACRIVMDGMSAFVKNTAEACEAMAKEDVADADRWRELAAICRRVATEPPTTFHEAIQLMFLTEIALWFGEDHSLASPGRMDQTLRRFYEADKAAGRITPRGAFELICCLFIQMNRILWPGSAVAVMVGGLDRQGTDVTNELTYLCLAARLATRLVYPTVGVAWHRDTPGELTDFSTELLATGIGDPAFFNDEVISEGLRRHGVSEEDSHYYMNSTCVEIKVAGRSNMWVTQPYFNMPKALLNVMAAVAEGKQAAPQTFDELQEQVREDLAAQIRFHADRLDSVWKQRAKTGGFPLASCFVKDCLERGRDFDRGGARYNWVENSFVGLANLVDGLIAVNELAYDKMEMSIAEFHRILQKDFEGHEDLRQRIINTLPKYGNDDDVADALAEEWAEFAINSTESHTVGLHCYMPGFFCWIVHERFGAETGATPDGRRAGWPLADGAGGAQGREKKGPTASVKSTTKWSHVEALGGLVHNAKFAKGMLKKAEDRKALRHVIETYMKRGGFEMQINVVGKEDLLDAQVNPEQYPDLLVRVAGYSDYFVHLNKNMQDEVIARTEHEL
ncbi:MAG: pyruvate formate lyase family protein [Planctomycetota bacterium]